MVEERRNELNKLIFEDLGFCGCGNPEQDIIFIKNILDLRNKWHNDKLTYKKYRKLIKKEFIKNWECAEEYILYMLNDKEFLEHGSSVGGSWLLNKGHKLLKITNEEISEILE